MCSANRIYCPVSQPPRRGDRADFAFACDTKEFEETVRDTEKERTEGQGNSRSDSGSLQSSARRCPYHIKRKSAETSRARCSQATRNCVDLGNAHARRVFRSASRPAML